MITLPKCPTYGKTVEYFVREGRWSGRAEIRCVGHHSIGTAYAPGSKEKAQELLIKKWNEMIIEQGNS